MDRIKSKRLHLLQSENATIQGNVSMKRTIYRSDELNIDNANGLRLSLIESVKSKCCADMDPSLTNSPVTMYIGRVHIAAIYGTLYWPCIALGHFSHL